MLGTLEQFYLNSERRLLGEDARMYGAWEQNFICVHLHFERAIPHLHEHLRRHMTEWLRQPDHRFRARVSRRGRQFYYDARPVHVLVAKMLHTTQSIENDAAIVARAVRSGMNMIIVHTDRTIAFCGNHQFIDGVSGYHTISSVFDECRSIQQNFARVPKFLYVPMLSELSALSHLSSDVLAQRNLEYHPSWTVPNSQSQKLNIQFPLATLKRIKRELSTACDHSLSFVSILGALVTSTTFHCVPTCARLTVATIVAFEHCGRFNNYGLITTTVTRTTSVAALARNIHTGFAHNRSMAALTYIASNVHNLHTELSDCDILLSTFPLSQQRPIAIKGIPLLSTQQFLNYNSKAIYVMGLSCTRYTNLSFSIRCPQIQIARYEARLRKVVAHSDPSGA